jgi:hypothetical protein
MSASHYRILIAPKTLAMIAQISHNDHTLIATKTSAMIAL